MESRKITIVSTTNSQTKSVIMSSATTLGELKADLDAAGVLYEDMDFFEGISKIKLVNDDSVLPTNIPYKGEVTNELVFMLTTSRKKIESGSPRQELYVVVRNRNLQEAIQEYFGKNFTQVTNKDLSDFITQAKAEVVDTESHYSDEEILTETKEEESDRIQVLFDVLDNLINDLYGEDVLDTYIYDSLIASLNTGKKKSVVETTPSPYSNDEIDDMFVNMI